GGSAGTGGPRPGRGARSWPVGRTGHRPHSDVRPGDVRRSTAARAARQGHPRLDDPAGAAARRYREGDRPHRGFRRRRSPGAHLRMIYALTVAICAASLVLMLLAGYFAFRDRLINDLVLGLAALVFLGTLAQVVIGLVRVSAIEDGTEVATFISYLLSLPLIPLATTFLAIKEKTRWAMGSVAVGAFAVLVMTARLQQIWDLNV